MRKISSHLGLWLVLAMLVLARGLAVAGGNPDETKKLIAVLQSDAGLQEKGVACRQLAHCGTPEAIPVLAKLLADEKLSHMARFGLEAMTDPQAGAALREALSTLKGAQLVGVINSVGMRRDAAACDKLIELLKGSDAPAASAAAAALGRIATPPAAEALAQALGQGSADLKRAVADASLTCAEQLAGQDQKDKAVAIYDSLRQQAELPVYQRQAALQGAILTRGDAGTGLLAEQLRGTDRAMAAIALRAARLLPGTAVTEALAGELGKLPEENQVLLIQALGDRNDAAALPVLSASARQGAEPVRLAAVKELGRMGNASSVPLLLETGAGEGELAQAARTSLTAMPGKDADGAIVAGLSQADGKIQRVAIDVAGQRQIAGAMPGLLAATKAGEGETRLAALVALKGLASAGEIAPLVEVMAKAGAGKEKAAAQGTLSAAIARSQDKNACAGPLLAALPQATGEAKGALLQLLAQVGGEKALAAVREAAGDASNAEIRETALRALCERSAPDALPDLVRLTQNAPEARFKILALRGQFRVIPLMQASDEQKLAALKEALAQVERVEEKYAALAALAQIHTPDSLALVTPWLSDPKLQEEAAAAAVVIGGQIVKSNPDEVAAAMKLVKSSNWAVMQDAGLLLKKAQSPTTAEKAPSKRNASAGPRFINLFDGQTLEGWEGDPAVWSVKDGVIVGKAKVIGWTSVPDNPSVKIPITNVKQNNFLSTKKEYGNFILRLQVKLVGQKGNTGVQFRSIKIPNTPSMAGFQADFAEQKQYCGMLYDEKRRGILMQPKPEKITVKPGDWNNIVIRAIGDRIQILLNGVKTVDYTEKETKDPKTGQEIWKKGYIGLQTHAGTVMEVQFRNIQIRELGQ